LPSLLHTKDQIIKKNNHTATGYKAFKKTFYKPKIAVVANSRLASEGKNVGNNKNKSLLERHTKA
jgi:IQ calmodulin-binding motif